MLISDAVSLLKPENAYFGKKHWYRCDKGHEFHVSGMVKKRIQTKNLKISRPNKIIIHAGRIRSAQWIPPA